MPAFIFISNLWRAAVFTGMLALLFPMASAHAQSAPSSAQDQADGGEAFLSGPFSEFGEFDSNEDEEEDEKFFQSGRFFGVGLGLGLTTPTGNAGRLYQGGFPTVDFRLNYWFDFFVALQLGVRNSTHSYDVLPDGKTSSNLFRVTGQVKYYFDTKNFSAPLTFIGPHLLLGCGMYKRTDNLQDQGVTESSQAFGLNFGAGVELTIKPKKFYFSIEVLGNLVTFRDSFDPRFQNNDPINGVPDRTGPWIDTVGALTWTW
jgi:hypothetical protein